MYTVDLMEANGSIDPAETEGLSANAGQPLPEGTPKASEDEVVEKLRECYDPEIPVNIYDLGLVYDLQIKDSGDVAIEMTLTAPACPVAGEMPGMVANAVSDLGNVGQVTVTLTWDPPWTMDRMSEDARLAMGFG
jgi:FeS assembly SUF system protein